MRQPIQNPKRVANRNQVRLDVERLEDRVAPAGLKVALLAAEENTLGNADVQTKLSAAQKQGTEQAGRLEIAVRRVTELQSETAALKPLREQLAGAQGELERFRNEAEKGAKKREESAKKDDDALSKARTAEKTLREYADAMKAKLNEAEGRIAMITNGFTAIKQENADLAASLGAVRKERDDAAALATGHASEIALQKSASESAALEMARLRAAADGAVKEKAALASALEKATVERIESLERSRQQAAVLAANREEIERLAKLLEAAEAAAKKAAPLPQPPASLRKKSDSKAVSELERQLAESLASLERTQTAEREAAERARKIDEERAGLTAELSRQAAEFDSLKGEAARVKAELDQIRSQPNDAPAGPAASSDREKSLETERDALASALERAKQHVGVLQARRDMLRDEVATLRTRLGIGGKITSGEGTPISN